VKVLPLIYVCLIAYSNLTYSQDNVVGPADVRVKVISHPDVNYESPIAGFVSKLPKNTMSNMVKPPYGYLGPFIQKEHLFFSTLNADSCLTVEVEMLLKSNQSNNVCMSDGLPFKKGTKVDVLSSYLGNSLIKIRETGEVGFINNKYVDENLEPIIYGVSDIDPKKWNKPGKWLEEANNYFTTGKTFRVNFEKQFISNASNVDFRVYGMKFTDSIENFTEKYIKERLNSQNIYKYHIPSLTKHFVRTLSPSYGRIDSAALQIQEMTLDSNLLELEQQLYSAQHDLFYYGYDLSKCPGILSEIVCPKKENTFLSLKTKEYESTEKAELESPHPNANVIIAGPNAFKLKEKLIVGINNKWAARKKQLLHESRRKMKQAEIKVNNLSRSINTTKIRLAVNNHLKEKGLMKFTQPTLIRQNLVREGEDVIENQPLMLISKPDTFLIEWIVDENDKLARLYPEGQTVSMFLKDPLELPRYLKMMRGSWSLLINKGISTNYNISEQRFYGMVRLRNAFEDESGVKKVAIIIEFYRPVVPGGWLVEVKPINESDQNLPLSYKVTDNLKMLVSRVPLINSGDRMNVLLVPFFTEKIDHLGAQLFWDKYFD
jgi:hypothetical protein